MFHFSQVLREKMNAHVAKKQQLGIKTSTTTICLSTLVQDHRRFPALIKDSVTENRFLQDLGGKARGKLKCLYFFKSLPLILIRRNANEALCTLSSPQQCPANTTHQIYEQHSDMIFFFFFIKHKINNLIHLPVYGASDCVRLGDRKQPCAFKHHLVDRKYQCDEEFYMSGRERCRRHKR